VEGSYLGGALYDRVRWRSASRAQDHVRTGNASRMQPQIFRASEVERHGCIAGSADADEYLPAMVKRNTAIWAL
jgi:hypothetical protein